MSGKSLVRVLVVDDNVDNVTSTVLLLQAHGYDVQGCEHGAEVMRRVESYRPDVVILDLNLPGKSGWELAREIRAWQTDKRVVLIAISGEYMKASDRALSEMRGFDHHLTKPADPDELLPLIARLTKGAR